MKTMKKKTIESGAIVTSIEELRELTKLLKESLTGLEEYGVHIKDNQKFLVRIENPDGLSDTWRFSEEQIESEYEPGDEFDDDE